MRTPLEWLELSRSRPGEVLVLTVDEYLEALEFCRRHQIAHDENLKMFGRDVEVAP